MPDTSGNRARRARPERRSSARPRVGLALAGGGPLGGIYEVGALLALADSLDGLDFNDLDVYVGVSSGGFVAAALANGISPAQMYRLFIDDGADAALTPEIFLRPAFGEFARRAAALPRPRRARDAAVPARPVPPRRDGVVRDAGARDADRRVRQRARSTTSCAGCSPRPGRTNDFRKLAAQALPGRDQPRHRRVGDLRRARPRPRADLARDRGLAPRCPGLFPPVAHRRRVLRRRRAQQDAARLGRARRGRRAAAVRQSAGAVRREPRRRATAA